MTPLHVQTPLVESAPLSRALGRPVWLKMESAQPVGSFKIRGVGALCQQRAREGAKALISSSGGNAGYAVAYAGRKLGLPATVVIPRPTSAASRERMLAEGARLIEHGAAWDDSHEKALELAARAGAAYVHPFDDPAVWDGNATLIEEVARADLKPAAVVVSVGGGGLLIGVLRGMVRAGWSRVPVVAAETRGAASYAAALKAGKLVTLKAIKSVATTLGARTVAPEALAWASRRPILSHLVSDRDAVRACARFLDDHRVLVEPACGAALACAYGRAPALRGRGPVLMVVCGGAGVSLEMLRRWTESL